MDWQAMVFLGAYHGINPGMGWLFAVALGCSKAARAACGARCRRSRRSRAVGRGVLVTVGLAQIVLPPDALNVLVAGLLISMGLYRLWRHRHPRFGGMQVGFRDLTAWSFLMASAHGAGLMVLPFVMPRRPVAAAVSNDMRTTSGAAATTVPWSPSTRVVPRRHDAGRLGCLSQAGPRASSHRLVQRRLGVGRRAGRHRHCRSVEVMEDAERE